MQPWRRKGRQRKRNRRRFLMCSPGCLFKRRWYDNAHGRRTDGVSGTPEKSHHTSWVRSREFPLNLCRHLLTMHYMEGAQVHFIECIKWGVSSRLLQSSWGCTWSLHIKITIKPITLSGSECGINLMLGWGKSWSLRGSEVFRRISLGLGKDLGRMKGLWEPGRTCQAGRSLGRARI